MTVQVDAQLVAKNIRDLQDRLSRLSPERDVRIVAVTKGFGVDAPRAALAAGLTMIGENYAQELVSKHEELSPDERERIEWHFLGRLQRNKVRSLASIVSVWQSVDRVELIDEIAHRAPGAKIMIQLNLSEEPQKGGAPILEGSALVGHARDAGLDVVGLMGVGSAGDPVDSAAAFGVLVALAEDLGLSERSIGMSDDLEVAVTQGSTMVRVGTGLFGARAPRDGV
jgi:pyridoxal phosphate enzyme (YggS family)